MAGRYESLIKRICCLYGIPFGYIRWSKREYAVCMNPDQGLFVKSELLSYKEKEHACLECLKSLFLINPDDSPLTKFRKREVFQWHEITSDSASELELKLALRGV